MSKTTYAYAIWIVAWGALIGLAAGRMLALMERVPAADSIPAAGYWQTIPPQDSILDKLNLATLQTVEDWDDDDTVAVEVHWLEEARRHYRVIYARDALWLQIRRQHDDD